MQCEHGFTLRSPRATYPSKAAATSRSPTAWARRSRRRQMPLALATWPLWRHYSGPTIVNERAPPPASRLPHPISKGEVNRPKK